MIEKLKYTNSNYLIMEHEMRSLKSLDKYIYICQRGFEVSRQVYLSPIYIFLFFPMLTKSLNVVSNILLFHLFCKKQIKFSINSQAMFRLLYEILIG